MKNKGFTLIELSIVIVIVSLLVVAITGGKSIMRSVEVKSVMVDINNFKGAINIFTHQYRYLPGDLPNGKEYWPNCSDHLFASFTSPCSGNGDGKLESLWNEGMITWEHLSLAELIPGNYKAGWGPVIDVNMPGSKIDGGGYLIGWYEVGAPGGSFAGKNLNAIRFAHKQGTFGRPILTPIEAKAIDTKYDDGIIDKGNIIARGHGGSNCMRWGPRRYLISNDNIACYMIFAID